MFRNGLLRGRGEEEERDVCKTTLRHSSHRPATINQPLVKNDGILKMHIIKK